MQNNDLQILTPFNADVFTIPFKDGYILYIPKLGLVAGVEEKVQMLIQAMKDGEPIESNSFSNEWVSALSSLGLFEPELSVHRKLEDFRPTHVTLSLTSRCQLSCTYCYIHGGENVRDLNEKIMLSAINMAAQNASDTNTRKFTISFHGEGEPTANWRLFKKAIISSKEVANKLGLEVDFALVSNGIWNAKQRDFIAEHFNNLTISLDGPAEIQNQQRMMANGSPSFSKVWDNAEFLDSKGVDYGIRSTVLPQGIKSMLPFIDMVANELKCDSIAFEPVFRSGRAANMVINEENFFHTFAEQFQKAICRGSELGIHIGYSGCRSSHFFSSFCKSTGSDPNFFVSTKGNVSSCYEAIDPTSKKGKFTVYGYYDFDKKKFILDETKLQRIRNFDVRKLNHCRDCFIRWNCAGDCFARADILLTEEGDLICSNRSPRCLLNRETTLNNLVNRAILVDVLTPE